MKTLAVILVMMPAILLIACGSRIEESRVNPPGPTDADVIEQLRAAGSDLSREHPIDFYLYFPSRDAADRVSKALSSKDFEVSVKPSARGTEWLVLAQKQVIPTTTAIERLSAELDAIALSEKGDYDGWEAPVVR